jgi:hypothetical protein
MVKALESLVGEVAQEARDRTGALYEQQKSCDSWRQSLKHSLQMRAPGGAQTIDCT